MLKLYKFDDNDKQFWETWDNGDGSHTVHWGVLGTIGETRIIKAKDGKKPEQIIQEFIEDIIKQGYKPAEEEYTIIIEYAVTEMGTRDDLDKRHSLEERMNETLGWAGLGHCDGGSMGIGTMEVFNIVVDYELAKEVIENDLAGTEFGNYTRIYGEDLG